MKGFFGAGSSSSTESETERETIARSESVSTSAEGEVPSQAEATPEKKAPVKDTIPLGLNVKLSSVPPMSVSQKRTARER